MEVMWAGMSIRPTADSLVEISECALGHLASSAMVPKLSREV